MKVPRPGVLTAPVSGTVKILQRCQAPLRYR